MESPIESPYTIGPLSPKRQRLSRLAHHAEVSLRLTNHSPYGIPFRISALDKEHCCQFEFNVPGESASLAGVAEFYLPPQTSTIITMRVVTPTSAFFGVTARTHHFTTTLTHVADGRNRTFLGELRHPPLIGPWLMLILFLCFGTLTMQGITAANLWPSANPPHVSNIQPSATETPVRPDWVEHPPTPIPTPEIALTPSSYTDIFQTVGSQYNLDWRLLAATAQVESRFNPYALGHDGDMGLMQIIPITWGEWAPKAGVANPYDPYSNVRVGAAYLAYLRGYCAQRGYSGERWMLVAYNWGPNNLNRFAQKQGRWEDLPDKQRRYALTILGSMATIEWQIPTPEAVVSE